MWSSNRTGSYDIYLGGYYDISCGAPIEWPTNLCKDEFLDRAPVLSPVLEDTMFVAWESYRNGSWDVMGAAVKIYIGAVKPPAESGNPQRFHLFQNYPNPFNASTIIRYDLPRPGFITIEIYNLLGQKVRTLVAEWMPAGSHRVNWDGHDVQNRLVPSGVYFYQIQSGQFSDHRKMVVLR